MMGKDYGDYGDIMQDYGDIMQNYAIHAIVSGLDWANDFDPSARVSARLWGAYLRMWE